ncbi:hypothetical protein, partial [Streptomyces sp. NPDC056154]|uniref:hypothetical protein n=1 Tax=Streptomyces sp. NPDC056154 TaxID=3345729 RepID=UPI0035D95C5B
MQSLSIVELRASGYLGRRAALSYDRLEQEEYQPDQVFKKEYGWPADLEGRILLAMIKLAQATGREHRNLN